MVIKPPRDELRPAVGRVVAECIDFCDVQIVWRAVLLLGQKGRLWVLFRLLVVGFMVFAIELLTKAQKVG